MTEIIEIYQSRVIPKPRPKRYYTRERETNVLESGQQMEKGGNDLHFSSMSKQHHFTFKTYLNVIYVGKRKLYPNEVVTDNSALIDTIYNESNLLSDKRALSIFPNYLSIVENDSTEQALVYLYISLIDLLKDSISCESFIDSIHKELLSIDAIVHILNALSPIKDKIRNWSSFVLKAEKIIIEQEGKETADDLLKVIL